MHVRDSLLGSVTHLGSVPSVTKLLQRSRNVAESTSGAAHQSHRARLAEKQLCCSDVSGRTPADEFLNLLLQMRRAGTAKACPWNPKKQQVLPNMCRDCCRNLAVWPEAMPDHLHPLAHSHLGAAPATTFLQPPLMLLLSVLLFHSFLNPRFQSSASL